MLKHSKIPPETPKQPVSKSIWKAPQVVSKLDEAKTKLANLEKSYRAMVADAVLAENQDETSMTALEKDIEKTNAQILRLSVAYESALEADNMLRNQHLTEGRKSQIRVVTAQLRIADKATEEFSAALTQTIKAYAAMVEHRVKAGEAASSPIFGNIDALRLIQSAACGERAVFKFAEIELARISGQILGVMGISGEARFPGANTWDGKYRLMPEQLPEITETLNTASDELLKKLKMTINNPNTPVEENITSEFPST